MKKILSAVLMLSSPAVFAAPVCVLNELGSDDLQMSNAKTLTVALHAEDDKLKEFGSVLYPELSFKANHYGETLYVGLYKGGKELARAGGKGWAQIVSPQPGKNPFGVVIVDCYAKDPSQKLEVAAASASVPAAAPGQAGVVYNGYASSCPAGQVMTQYGCLQHVVGPCPAQQYVYYNNVCIPILAQYQNGYYGYPYGYYGNGYNPYLYYNGYYYQNPQQQYPQQAGQWNWGYPAPSKNEEKKD